jgi:hypothetical protein
MSKNIAIAIAIVAVSSLTVLAFQQVAGESSVTVSSEATNEDITAKRSSKTVDGINYCLTVIPGNVTHKTQAIISITNLSYDEGVKIPKPIVMPLAGSLGHKNTIEVRDKNGNLLRMTGIHADYVKRPVFDLMQPAVGPFFAHSSKSFCFELEGKFPELSQPGQYIINFGLISKPSEYNRATWKGSVDLSVSIDKPGPYYMFTPQHRGR